MWLKVVPVAIVPLLKLLSSAVTVCAVLSELVQVTVVPALTVIVAVVKLIFAMFTFDPDGGGFVVVVLLLPLLQDIILILPVNKIQKRIITIFFIKSFHLNT